jgi:translation initiation factor IF-2
MALKLIKVAKDFNVGLHSIVETLRANGFNDIEERPTAEVSDDMITVLKKEYQKDLAIKQEAEKLLRPVLPKSTPSPSQQVVRPPAVLAPPESKPVLVQLPKVETNAPTPAHVEKAEIERLPREVPQLRVVGKIELEKPKETPKETPKPPPAPTREEKPRFQPSEAHYKKPQQPQQQQQRPPQQQNQQNQNKNKSDQHLSKAHREHLERSGQMPKPQNPPKQPVVIAPPAQEEKAPEQEFHKTEAPTLRGLKILGKVDTDRFKEQPSGQTSGNNNRNRGGRNDNRGGGGNRGGDNRNRPAGQGQNQIAGPRPAGTPGAPGATNDDPNKRKRKRKKIQQPITAESLQKSLLGGNQGTSGNNSGGGGNNSGGGDRRHSNRPTPPPGGYGPMKQIGPATSQGPKEVSQKEIEDKIRQTMARMGAGASRKRQKVRRDKRDVMRERAEAAEAETLEEGMKLQVTEFISVSDLASLMNKRPADIIKSCMSLGIFVSINQRLDAELIEVIASDSGFEVQFISAEEQVEVVEEEPDDAKDIIWRQPIVTVMGHVDHGKTSLLDFIRNANVASGEAGGITQHIGAYEVALTDDPRKRITFLDTPGHEAFTAMRARGAKVTDIAIIVVAADDSIMPQTKEAIAHCQAASVPIVFAINKIDKAGSDPERIKNELAQMNLLVEDWGGKIQSQDISAKKGLNIDKLLEKVLLEAELLELVANPKRRANGTVLEASLDKGRGYVCKILVENGTIRDGDPIIAGEFSGKVKALFNERGKKVKEAGPAIPVLVLGLPGAPQAGEKIRVANSEAEAREIAQKRSQILREQSNRANKRISLEEIGRRLALGNFKELKLIVKGDVDGSIEALADSLIKLSIEKVQVNVIHKGVGQIVDSDIMLASASDAIIIGFQVRPSVTARKLAEKEGVEIKLYSIIYEAIEEIKSAMEGMLEPTKEEEIVGQTEVREVYKISKLGTIAGCYVQEGKISRNHYIRIIRDGIVVFPANSATNAELGSLKRFKDDAKEVKAGFECGLTIKNFNDIKEGDIIESYVINEVKATL